MALPESTTRNYDLGGDVPPDIQGGLGEVVSIGNEDAQDNGGLPFDIQISSISGPKSERLDGIGTQETSVVTLEDGSVYIFRKTLPEIPLQDISVDYSMPLSTRVKGFNTYLARKLAQKGFISRMVGTNQSHKFTLLHDAQAMLHILNEDDRIEESFDTGPRFDAGKSVMSGYSMGAMKMLVALGLAPRMGREVPIAVGLDPCLAIPVDYTKELSNLSGLIAYLGREVLELPRITISNVLSEKKPCRSLIRAAHFITTIGLTPQYFSNSYDKWNVLATGEAGQYLDRIPNNQQLVLHFFENSHFNNNAVYEDRLSNLPFYRAVHEPGYHLSGADTKVIGRVVNKLAWGVALSNEGFSGHDLSDELTDKILS